MIILGKSEPTVNLINKEIGSLYFDTINKVFYVKYSTNEWKTFRELLNFEEYKEEIEQKIISLFQSFPTLFEIEGKSLVIRSIDGTFLNSLNLPTVVIEKEIQKITEPSPKVYETVNSTNKNKIIIQKSSSKEFKITADSALTIIEFDKEIYSSFQEIRIDGYDNFLLVPENGFYYLSGKVKLPKKATTKVAISLLKNNQILTTYVDNTNSFSEFFLTVDTNVLLNKDDILEIKLEVEKDMTLSEVEIYLELKD